MPERIRSILLHANITDARELASAADRLYKAHSTDDASASINKVTSKSDKKKDKHQEKRSDYCFYHARFGKKAHKCEQLCAWPAENAQAGPR